MGEHDARQASDLLLRRKAQLLAFLERRLGSRADAEDILQDALLVLVAKRDSLRHEESIVPWFYQVLRNLLVDYHRRRSAQANLRARLARTTAGDPMTEDPALFHEVCACVRDVMAALRPPYAAILHRVELEEQPVRTVARDLGISPGNASVRLHRARRALLEGLRRMCGACFDHGCLDCTCRRGQQGSRRRAR